MVKVIKYIIIVVLFGFLTVSVVQASSQTPFYDPETSIENFPYINQQLLESSRYTQTDDIHPDRLNTYLNDFQLNYTEEELELLGFDLMFDTNELMVYFEKDSFSMIVINKVTGYMWSSRPEFQGISGQREDNQINRNMMNSGLWVEHVRAGNVSSSNIVLDSLYKMAGVTYQTDAAMTPDNDNRLHPYLIQPGSYSTLRVETRIRNKTNTGFVVGVNLKSISVKFDVEFTIDGGEIEILIPNESIEEASDVFRLLAIHIFPYFGSAREDKIPGYIVIPDGVGALVRTDRPHNTTFQARFFGSDIGYQNFTLPDLTLPIYGIVHHVNNDAFYVNVKEGAETSQLRGQFWGSSTRYHRMGSRFGVRTIFRNVINKAGDGSDAIRPEITGSNYKVAYKFLSNDEANYVGIGSDYRNYLINENILSQNEKADSTNIPMHFSYIMSDREPSFFGTAKVSMTTASDVLNNYELFKTLGLSNQQINLYGWSNDGFVYRAPYRFRISDRNDFANLVDSVVSDDNTIYLDNDYIVSSELSRRILYNRDVARNVSRLKITMNRRMINGQTVQMYYLYPERSLAFAQSDVSSIDRLGVSGLSMDYLGSTIFSYYDGQLYERSDTINTYQQIADLYDSLLLSRPNAYMFSHTDGYMNLAITNSQYDYYTDLVPLIPIVLKGSISYYTPYLNFNALAEDRLLTMVDFAVNPSYVLTEEQTYQMRFTLANRFFTTTRSDYVDEIVEVYDYLNNALRHVSDAYIINRQVLETGLVLVTYSNGVSIYVNYNYQAKTHSSHTINARDYKVVLT